MNVIRYMLWPRLKVRLKYWWWIVKYRGKKNIPREVVFGAMAKSLERMNENLMSAYRETPDDMTAEEKMELFKALQRAKDLEGDINRLKGDDSE